MSIAQQSVAELGRAPSVRVRQRGDHAELEVLLQRLRSGAGAEQDELLTRAARLVPHAHAEEDVLLPRLRAVLDPGELRGLGRRWELVRRTAPTRPHAVVSGRPPGNVLSGSPLAAVDRLRDRSDRTARRSPGRVGSASRTAGHGLARVARPVEHLPLPRLGERASTRADRTEAGR